MNKIKKGKYELLELDRDDIETAIIRYISKLPSFSDKKMDDYRLDYDIDCGIETGRVCELDGASFILFHKDSKTD